MRLEQRIRFELEQNPFLEEELNLENETDQEIESSEPDNEHENEDFDSEISSEEKENQEVDWDTILNDENNYAIKIPRDNRAEYLQIYLQLLFSLLKHY